VWICRTVFPLSSRSGLIRRRSGTRHRSLSEAQAFRHCRDSANRAPATTESRPSIPDNSTPQIYQRTPSGAVVMTAYMRSNNQCLVFRIAAKLARAMFSHSRANPGRFRVSDSHLSTENRVSWKP
jgi:hypothetical protein